MDINDIHREAREMTEEELEQAVADLRTRRRMIAERPKSTTKRAAKPKVKTEVQIAAENAVDIDW